MAILACAALVGACEGGRLDDPPPAVPGGDAERGAAVIREVGCGACHTIPGIDGADGTVGPPLSSWRDRAYIAGARPNEPPELIDWLLAPHAVEPATAMPDLDLTDRQARDVAAYLYTLD